MRYEKRMLLLTALAFGACEPDEPLLTGRLATGHVVVEGRVIQLPSNAPVSGAVVTVGIREHECGPYPNPFTLQTSADGTFGGRLESLMISTERACITFDVIPPAGTNLQRTIVTVEQARFVLTTSPPDTVRVTVSLQPL